MEDHPSIDSAPTKRQLKRQARAERMQDARKQKKMEKKEAKQQQRAANAAAAEEDGDSEPFPALPFEPQNPFRLERKAALMKSTALAATGSKSSPAAICIDVDGFEPLMTPQENVSMVSQICYAYAANKCAPIPVQLHVAGNSPFVFERLGRMGSEHWKDWNAHIDTRPVQDIFDKSKIVYLSADSENEITELEQDKVYVIGGIVDRNRHKGLCSTRANTLGLTTARFALQKYHPNSGARVLTTNHCVDILLEFIASQQWAQAFQRSIPVRKDKAHNASKKKKRGDSEGAGDEEEEEEEQEEETPVVPTKVEKRAVIMGADEGLGLELAKTLYAQGWHLLLAGSKERGQVLHDLCKNELNTGAGIAVHTVVNCLAEGDAARLKEVCFHRFPDKHFDLLVLNEGLEQADHFTAKACVVRELKRFFNPNKLEFPRTVLVRPANREGAAAAGEEEYLAWSTELKSRLQDGVFECNAAAASAPSADLDKLMQWIAAGERE